MTYTYDAAGAKLRKVAGSAVTEYLSGIQWDNSANTSAAPVINFIQTEEGRAVRNTDNTYTYQYDLSDHLGNARLTFNQNPASLQAQALQADNYYPFGLRASATAGSNHYLYNHKELQDETGFYDYGARQYDPLIGRWLGFDPMAEAGRRHSPYEYGMNNPIRMVDPDGMWARVPLPAGASAPDFDGDPGSHTSGDEAEDAKKQQVGADGLTADQWVASSRPDADPGLADGFRQDNNAQERDGDKNGKTSTNDQADKGRPSYTPPPKVLPGFPDAERINPKGGRPRWRLRDGDILEWDGQHGELERYNKRGKHTGVWDKEGRQTKPKVPGRYIDPVSISSQPDTNPALRRGATVIGAGTGIYIGVKALEVIITILTDGAAAPILTL